MCNPFVKKYETLYIEGHERSFDKNGEIDRVHE